MDGKEKKVFYDIHCHALNLSHAGLLAFLNRFLKDRTVSFSDLLGKGKFSPGYLPVIGDNSQRETNQNTIDYLKWRPHRNHIACDK